MAVFGDTLRQARAYKGVTLREAERATRINRYHLAALEEENFSALPPLIYQRGIVRNYATYLDLDPDKLLQIFDETRGVPAEPEVGVVVKPLDMPSHWAPNFAIIAFMVVMSAIVFAWFYSAYFAPTDAAPTPDEIIATVTPVDSQALIIPTATAVPPTSTPQPTATATPTQPPAPTATPTDVPQQVQDTSTSSNQVTQQSSDQEAVDYQPTEEPTATPDGAYTFNFVADDYIELQVVVDGTLQYDGALAAGDSTGFLTGNHFQVSTSDPSLTQIVKSDGSSFYMGGTFFDLP
jgi:cytoskeletal protein RodZ